MNRMNPGKSNKSPKNSLAHLAATNSNFQKQQKTLVSPVLREVGKLAAGVASVSTLSLNANASVSGSATGNPRNKVALSPGHSLMDWIRLGASGKDLTGVGSQAGHLSVTSKELSSHCKEDDAWLAIRGKVYNVTSYLPFHPGGPEELMKGAGIDATKLFDQVHPWVNYDSILQKCFIGRLVNVDPNIDTESLFVSSSKQKTTDRFAESDKSVSNTFVSPQPTKKLDASLDTNDGKKLKTSDNVVNISTSDNNTNVIKISDEASGRTEISDVTRTSGWTSEDQTKLDLPRFDWIQKLNYITVIFYTKPFANPLIEISPPNTEGMINIKIAHDGQVFCNELVPERGIANGGACQVRVSYETGKIEVVWKKQEAAIWRNYGVLTRKHRTDSVLESRHPYVLLKKLQVSHDTFLLQLVRTDGAMLVVPIGKHVKVYVTVQGDELYRSYTPVSESVGTLPGQGQAQQGSCLWLLVKRYPQGSVSQVLCDAELRTTFHLSKPLGSFHLASTERRELCLLLAAGTGITPMLNLLAFLLQRRIRRSQKVTLLFFNKTEKDILLRDQFEKIQEQDSRFKVQNVLSEADESWQGSKGHISKKLIQAAIREQIQDTGYCQRDVFVSVCGPTAFTNLCRDLLLELDIQNDQYHLFAG